MLGRGEFFDLLNTAVILKMRFNYSQAEIDDMIPYHYELMNMMINKELTRKAEGTP